jgi:ferredoxin
VARLPRRRHRRPAVHRHLRGHRSRDGRPRLAPPGARAHAAGAASADSAHRAGRHRRARHHASRRQVHVALDRRHRAAVHERLRAAVDRPGRDRGLAGRHPRAQLLDPAPDRSAAVAQAAPRDDPRLRPLGGARAGCGHRCVGAVDARTPRRHRRTDPLPLRDARPHAAGRTGVPALPRRRRHPGQRERPLLRARARAGQAHAGARAGPVRHGAHRRPRCRPGRAQLLAVAHGRRRPASDQRQARAGRPGERAPPRRARDRRGDRARRTERRLRPGRTGHEPDRAHQRRNRRHAGARDVAGPRRRGVPARGVVDPQRAQRARARVPRRGGSSPRAAAPRPPAPSLHAPRRVGGLLGRDFDAEGRITTAALLDLDLPLHAEYRLCGPRPFVADLEAGLLEAGVDPARLAHESFGGAPAAQPSTRPSAPPSPVPADRALSVAFTRSRVTAAWDPRCANLLEFAEAVGVDAPSGCRVGACHECRAPVLEGAVRHHPEPAAALSGSALLCCAIPQGDLVLDA